MLKHCSCHLHLFFMTDIQTVRFVKGRVCVCVSWGWTYVSVCVCWWEVAHVLAAGASVDLHLIITADRTSFFSLCPWPTNCDTQTLKNTPASHSSNSAEAIEELLCLVLNPHTYIQHEESVITSAQAWMIPQIMCCWETCAGSLLNPGRVLFQSRVLFQ